MLIEFALVQHSQGFYYRDDEAIEGCGELGHFVVAADWDFGLVELAQAYAVGDDGELSHGQDDKEVEDEVDGNENCGEGSDERPHESPEGAAGDLDGDCHWYGDDLCSDDFVELPAEAVG